MAPIPVNLCLVPAGAHHSIDGRDVALALVRVEFTLPVAYSDGQDDVVFLTGQLIVVDQIKHILLASGQFIVSRKNHAVVRLTAHDPDGQLGGLQIGAYFEVFIGFK